MGSSVQRDSARRYDSSGRRARAEATRLEVVGAAHDLFVAKGYAATTVGDIGAAAQVSAPTIYAAFGSKAGLLKRCIDVALAGDPADVPVADRPLAQWVYEAGDPVELLGRYATMMGVLANRAAPIYDVLVRAADGEPGLRELLADLDGQRHRAAGIVAEAVAERGGLAPGRTVKTARDVIWLLNDPTVYTKLTARRGWSHPQYVAWARDSLVKLVLEPPTSGVPPRPRC